MLYKSFYFIFIIMIKGYKYFCVLLYSEIEFVELSYYLFLVMEVCGKKLIVYYLYFY